MMRKSVSTFSVDFWIIQCDNHSDSCLEYHTFSLNPNGTLIPCSNHVKAIRTFVISCGIKIC